MLARLDAQIVLRLLLDRISVIEMADIGQWLPSRQVRRIERLELWALPAEHAVPASA